MQKIELLCDWLLRFIVIACFLPLLVIGCGGSSGGGGDGDGDGDGSINIIQGYFLDSAVEGLDYHTTTQSGETDSSGTFNYVAGEIVTFSIGNLELGSTAAQDYLTPVDLVANATDESDSTVINMSKLIQALDSDGDVSNGIKISDEIKTIVSDSEVDFELGTSEFDTDQSTQNLLTNLNNAGVFTDTEPRTLPSDEDAQNHLADTLTDLPFNDFVGTWSGPITVFVKDDSGSGGMTLVVNSDGTGAVAFDDDEDGFFAISSFKIIDGVLHYDWPNTGYDPEEPNLDCLNWYLPATLALDGTFQASGTICGEGGGVPGSISGTLTLSE